MRYLLAIAALVLSGVLLLLGIGQRTFLAGPAETTFPVETNSDTSYAIINAPEFDKVEGQANVVVRGDTAFVATGASRDVEGWVAPYLHAELSVSPKEEKLLSALVAAESGPESDDTAGDAEGGAEEPTRIDPRGSDLWLEERSVDGEASETETDALRVPVNLDAGQAVIIASNGNDPVPADVSLVWVKDRQTPWAGPLLVSGAVLALVGGILYLLAIDHDRRGLGPRRGRKGPLQGIRNVFTRKPSKRMQRTAAPVLGLALALTVSGCSPSYWPAIGADESITSDETAAPDAGDDGAVVPVTDAQISRILKSVVETAQAGDEGLDADLLTERFTGDALAQRAANYAIRSALSDYAVVPPQITADELDYELVQSTEAWPRTLFLTVASTSATEGDDASPSLALILRQDTPHENYLVSRVIALRGGISMPQAAPAEEGTALLSNDLESLEIAPGDVAGAYASILQDGTDSPQAELFDLDDDPLIENYGKARTAKAQADSDAKDQTMKFSVSVGAGEEPATALSTGAGGALVATTVIEEQIVDSAGGRYKPQAKDAVTALSGLEGEQDKLVQQVAHQMLFFVPSKSEGGRVEVLGVTSELVGARK